MELLSQIKSIIEKNLHNNKLRSQLVQSTFLCIDVPVKEDNFKNDPWRYLPSTENKHQPD